MKTELKDLLCEYLGQLMNDRQTRHDWLEENVIVEKINAVNLLLGFETKEESKFNRVLNIIRKDFQEG